MKLTTVLLALVLFVLGSGPASAHDKIKVFATIMKPEPSSLEVKTEEGQIVSIKLDITTLIWRDRKKVDISELKVGDSVVIDAWGHSATDAVALDVHIVPSITTPTDK